DVLHPPGAGGGAVARPELGAGDTIRGGEEDGAAERDRVGPPRPDGDAIAHRGVEVGDPEGRLGGGRGKRGEAGREDAEGQTQGAPRDAESHGAQYPKATGAGGAAPTHEGQNLPSWMAAPQ